MLEQVPVGRDAENVRAGDVIFCHRTGFASKTIRFLEHLRYGDSRWSHVAVVDQSEPGDTEPMLVEALTKAVERNPLSQYRHIEYAIARTQLAGADLDQAVAFLRSCIGQKYGWWTILRIVFQPADATKICSGLAAQTQVRGWANYPTDPASITPSRLAAYYEHPQNSGAGEAQRHQSSKETILPTLEQIRRYLTLTILPVAAGAAANWLLVHVHLLSAFHATQGSVAAELTQLGVFAVSAGLAFLASHHILKGSYKPPVTPPAA